MIVAALTGSIAMGKSETARMFSAQGVPVFDSDAEVHRLYERGGAAVSLIEAAFPGSVQDGRVDRVKLSGIVMSDTGALAELEALIHPLVQKAQAEFIADALKKDTPLIVLDIPLLFETGKEELVDRVIVVTAPADVQRQRALARSGMTAEKLDSVLTRQLPDSDKRSRADFIVDTSGGLPEAAAQVRRIVAQLRQEALKMDHERSHT